MEDVRALLERREADIVGEMETLTRPQQDQGSISFGKRVGDGTAMAVDRLSAVSAHDNLAGLLDQVRRALVKLDEGSYGRCDECGGDIGDARLEVRPWSVRCLRHS